MTRKTLLWALALLLGCQARAFTLSDKAQISILTCSPGGELYSLFGHTAIRVNDPQAGFDRVFNYGTFDFDTPHFYLKYARGLLPYQLSVGDFRQFMHAYRLDGRSVYEQRLLLDSLQRQRLFDLLLENYRPENRSYLYNFLFDNCTTRSRDILLESVFPAVEWHVADRGISFWNLLDEYLQASPWVKWGIHTILGQPGNRTATPFEYMFLPDYLMRGLEHATLDGKRLAADTETLYQAPPRPLPAPWWQSPATVFALGTSLLVLLLWRTRSHALLTAATLVMFLFSGIVGCLIVFLGGFTEHPITAPNWNILWANPLNLLAVWFFLPRRIGKAASLYLKAYMAILVIALPAWVICQPAVPPASALLICLLIYLCLRLRAEKSRY